MSNKHCQHIRENGLFCGAPPLRNEDYCYFHLEFLGRRMHMAKARALGERWELRLPPLEDIFSVQSGLMQVIDAVTADRLDLKHAHFLLSALRLAAANIRGKGWKDSSCVENDWIDDLSCVVSYPGFAQAHNLPKDLDISTPPEKAYPAPAHAEDSPSTATKKTARSVPQSSNRATDSASLEVTPADIALWRHIQQASSSTRQPDADAASQALAQPQVGQAASPTDALRERALRLLQQGHIAQVTPLDVELLEIYNTQGEAAMLQRARRHSADERRRQQRRHTRANRDRFAAEARARNAANLASHLLDNQVGDNQAAIAQPSVGKPAVAKPVADARFVSQPSGQELTAQPPTVAQPTVNPPVVSQPAVENMVIAQPNVVQPPVAHSRDHETNPLSPQRIEAPSSAATAPPRKPPQTQLASAQPKKSAAEQR